MNQFFKQNKRSLLDRLFTQLYRQKLGVSGAGVLFDRGVHLMRFPKKIEIGAGAYIKQGARLCPCNQGAKITIGERTTIGYDTLIFASSDITIGHDCMIAPNVYLVDSDHGIARSELMNCQSNNVTPITVGDDVWIGTGSVVLRGTKIASGCVIAANSVVRGQLEPYTIYGGSPAKKIGVRE